MSIISMTDQLPPLPEPDWEGDSALIRDTPRWEEDSMRAYGQQCYQAGIAAERERWRNMGEVQRAAEVYESMRPVFAAIRKG